MEIADDFVLDVPSGTVGAIHAQMKAGTGMAGPYASCVMEVTLELGQDVPEE